MAELKSPSKMTAKVRFNYYCCFGGAQGVNIVWGCKQDRAGIDFSNAHGMSAGEVKG